MQIPMNGTQPLDEDLFNALGHHSRNSLSTLRAGSHDPTSPVFAGGRMERLAMQLWRFLLLFYTPILEKLFFVKEL